MVNLNWNRTRKFKSAESKYEDGTVMRNGEVVKQRKDSLARRAAKAEREWLSLQRKVRK